MYYNRFRYYDSDATQYLSPDPIGLEGGVRPQAYVADPNSWIDPLGLAGCPNGNQSRSNGSAIAYPPGMSSRGQVDPKTNLASDSRTKHILYGDSTGGGHLWPGRPGKTPFPEGWSADKIMRTTSDLATDPTLIWRPQSGNGSFYTKKGAPARFIVTDAHGNLPVVDGVPIRVVISPAGEGIITSFPDYRGMR